jgi:hypothetical protein
LKAAKQPKPNIRVSSEVFEQLRARLVEELAAFTADPMRQWRTLSRCSECSYCVFAGLNKWASSALWDFFSFG